MNGNIVIRKSQSSVFSNQLKGDFLMLAVTMIWGSSYLFMKMGLHTMDGFNLVGLRFGIAFIIAAIIFYKRLARVNLQTIKYGFILGTIIFAAISSVTIGVKYTSVSNAGFLFSLTVIFVPLFLAIYQRKKPETKIIVGVGLSLLGIAFLTLNNTFQIGLGDFLIILGAVFYAFDIIVTDKWTKNVDSLSLGILQLGFTGAWGFLFAFLFETPHMPETSEAWVAILALSILCSAIGFIGQTVAQQYTTPTHTGLIFSLEPVFAAVFAFIFVGEVLTTKGYIGAVLVLIGVLAAKIEWKKPILKRTYREIVDGSEA